MKDKIQLDYYQILGLTPSATGSEIRKRFKKLSQAQHPDKGGSEEQYKKIKKAYDTLIEPSSRAIYNQGIMGGFNPKEFKMILRAVVEQAGNEICDKLVSGQHFPPLSIKALAKSFVTVKKGLVEIKLEQMQAAEKKLAKALKRIKHPETSMITQAIQTKLVVIGSTTINARMQLAVFDMLQDENKLIEELEADSPQYLSNTIFSQTSSTLV